MPHDRPSGPALGPAIPARQIPALSLIFRHLSQAERIQRVSETLVAARQDDQLLAHLLVALRGTDLAGAIWGHVMPGKTAMLWGPEVAANEAAATAGELLELLIRRLKSERVDLIQAVAGTPTASRLLWQHGFRSVVEPSYLACEVERAANQPLMGELDFIRYRPDDRPRLASIIERTYEETCDAPQLNGVREMDDIIEGYLATGAPPAAWWLIRADRRDIGCLLMADYPDRGHLELVYMGLIPNARGNGWGGRIVRFAQWQAARLGRRHVVLAVDAANAHALRVYSRAGFQNVRAQSIHLRILRHDAF